jgi:predicted lipoprotein
MTRQDRPRLGLGAIAVVVGVVAFVIVSLLFGFTVVSTQEEAALTDEFDPVTYAEESWDAVQTAIREEAVPLADVLSRIEPGADGRIGTEALTPIAEDLGLITTGQAHVYRVSGMGTVSDVDTETSRGSIGLDVEGYEGPIEVRAWIGSRLPSDESSVRDAFGFIEFGSFRDQTEFGQVARELNNKAVEGLEGLDLESLAGKTVDFTGAFTLRTFNQPSIDVSEIVLVPIEVTER